MSSVLNSNSDSDSNSDFDFNYDSDSSLSVNMLQLVLDEEEQQRKKRKKLLKALLLATVTLTVALREPDDPYYHDRLKWLEHVSPLNCKGPNSFYTMYRIHYPSHMKLFDLIDPFVRKDYVGAVQFWAVQKSLICDICLSVSGFFERISCRL